jgi:hypothetical protein
MSLQYQFYQTETGPGYIFRPTFNFPPQFDGLPVTHREESPLVGRPFGLLLAGGLPRLRRAALSAPPPTRWTILRAPSPSPLTSSGLSYFIFQKKTLDFWQVLFPEDFVIVIQKGMLFLCTGGVSYALFISLLISKLLCTKGEGGGGVGGGPLDGVRPKNHIKLKT